MDMDINKMFQDKNKEIFKNSLSLEMERNLESLKNTTDNCVALEINKLVIFFTKYFNEINIEFKKEELLGLLYREKTDINNIVNNRIEEKVDNIIKIDFTVGGASNNDEDVDIIYDIALNDLEVNCNLLSPYIKWKLIKDGEQISSGSLDYQFDTIKNGRLVLTTIQEDLPTYSSDKTNYDDYTFYMWFSDSCQGNLADCDNAEDQTGMLGQNLNGKIEVELYTGNKKELNRQPKTSLGESTCLDKYLVTLEPNKGTVETDTIFVYSGGTYTDLENPTRTDTITFETNGGTIVEPNYTNDQVTIPYTFQGWYLDENFETEITSSDIVETNSNHTLYAKWDSYDNEIVLPTLEKENANFSGWYKDSLLKLKIGWFKMKKVSDK